MKTSVVLYNPHLMDYNPELRFFALGRARWSQDVGVLAMIPVGSYPVFYLGHVLIWSVVCMSRWDSGTAIGHLWHQVEPCPTCPLDEALPC